MAKCPKCATRKAKRFCPALSQDICTRCCAELRMLELACPETCLHLWDARRSMAGRRLPKFAQHLLSKDKQELLSALSRFEAIVMLLERAIVEVQRYRFRDLSDEEALEGLQNAHKTYETLDRGIIYQHASESPRVQSVTRAVLEALEDLKKRLQERRQSSLIKTADFLACLELVAERIQFDMNSGTASQTWLRHAALYQPYPEKETQRLIVTG